MAPSSSRMTTRLLPNPESGALTRPPHVRAPRRAANVGSLTVSSSALLSRPASSGSTVGPLKLGKIDTNIRSYNRQDPFTAINTLIKLLTALPSRVLTGGGGGCQYKLLAIDEHKLCMHLCNIMEPFILSSVTQPDEMGSPSGDIDALFKRRVLLIRQPTEILDRIVSYIVDREDLMNFGITCKRLSEIVFPRHWEYRIIRAKVSMIGVWKHLLERVDLAANVRVVEVVDERSDRRVLVPKACRKSITSQGNKPGTAGFCEGIKAEEVVSGTSADEDSSSASGSEGGEVTVESITKKVSIHKRQEKYFVAALERMSGLLKLKWEANHSPISVLDEDSGAVWRTLVEKCGGLETLDLADNLTFSPLPVGDEDEDGENRSSESSKVALANLRSISLRATQFSYGAPKEPSMNRIATALHQCPNIENLEVTFRTFKAGTISLPAVNELLICGRWSHLRSLTLTNLSCFTPTTTTISQISTTTSPSSSTITPQHPLRTFLSAHPALEVLKLIDMQPAGQFRRLRMSLAPNTLPRLRELHAGKDIVNMILKSECDVPRPLEVIKGFKLIGASSFNPSLVEKCPRGTNTNADVEFYHNVKKAGGSLKRIEVEGWGDLDDVKMLTLCAPKLTWLDVGRRLKPMNGTSTNGVIIRSNPITDGSGRGLVQAPVTNMVEWAEVLSNLEELTTFHGVKFFYEISPNALPSSVLSHANDTSTGHNPSHVQSKNTSNLNISKTDRSRIKKNDEIASVLAWKCPKLKRVDHWDSTGGSGGKVIVLIRDSNLGPAGEGSLNKVRWEARKVKSTS